MSGQRPAQSPPAAAQAATGPPPLASTASTSTTSGVPGGPGGGWETLPPAYLGSPESGNGHAGTAGSAAMPTFFSDLMFEGAGFGGQAHNHASPLHPTLGVPLGLTHAPLPQTPPFAPLFGPSSYPALGNTLPFDDQPLFDEVLQHLNANDHGSPLGMQTWWQQQGPPDVRQSKLTVLIKAIAFLKARTFRARNTLMRASSSGAGATGPSGAAAAEGGTAAGTAARSASPDSPAAAGAAATAAVAVGSSPNSSNSSSSSSSNGAGADAAVASPPPPALLARGVTLGQVQGGNPTNGGLRLDDRIRTRAVAPISTGVGASAAAAATAATGSSAGAAPAAPRRMGLHLLAEIAIRTKRRVRIVREKAARERRSVAVQQSRKQGSAMIEAVREHSDRLRQLFDVLDSFRRFLDLGWVDNPDRQLLMPPNVTELILQYRQVRDGLDMSRQEWRARLEAGIILRAYAGWRRFTDMVGVPYPDLGGDLANSLAFLERFSLAHFLDGKKTQSIRRGLTSRGMPEAVATTYLERLIDDLRAANADRLLTWPTQTFSLDTPLTTLDLPPSILAALRQATGNLSG